MRRLFSDARGNAKLNINFIWPNGLSAHQYQENRKLFITEIHNKFEDDDVITGESSENFRRKYFRRKLKVTKFQLYITYRLEIMSKQ